MVTLQSLATLAVQPTRSIGSPEQPQPEMTGESQCEGTLNGFGELDTPEATTGVGLHKIALRAEAVEVNRAPFAAVDGDGRQSPKFATSVKLRSRHSGEAGLRR